MTVESSRYGRLVGLNGFARAGKDSAAAVLVAKFGYRRYAIGDQIRRTLLDVDPSVDGTQRLGHALAAAGSWQALLASGAGSEATRLLRYARGTLGTFQVPRRAMTARALLEGLDPLVDGRIRLSAHLRSAGGWEPAKAGEHSDEVRVLMQRWGSEAVRRTVGAHAWMGALDSVVRDDAALPSGAGRPVVIADVRLPFEAEWIRAHGGQVWRVERPGIGPANAHETEARLADELVDAEIPNAGSLDELTRVVHAVFSDAWSR